MELTGYAPACAKRSGGIRSVALADAGAVAGAQYAATDGTYKWVTLTGGVGFREYRFREDEAAYTESVAFTDGLPLVTHTLSFALERMDAACREAIEELCAATDKGLVAIVTTNAGVSFLVGYSEKFGAAYPLRPARVSGVSGSKPADLSAEKIVLVSRDTEKAREYTGNIPR
ncbi:hypothetical protein LJC45_02065 [Alistipes sp. OttesenSCG-928-B03]|nr:hypothetical protein [Alistipes sp. OttesenSCG-928-B03]